MSFIADNSSDDETSVKDTEKKIIIKKHKRCQAITIQGRRCKKNANCTRNFKSYCKMHDPAPLKQTSPSISFRPIETIDLEQTDPQWNSVVIPKDAKVPINWRELDTFLPPSCTKGYVQKEFLGYGNYGYVYQMCSPETNECDIALKFVPFNTTDKEQFEMESEYAYLMGLNGIGPKVFDYWICPKLAKQTRGKYVRFIKGGFMAMQMMDCSLHDYTTKQILFMRRTGIREDDIKEYHKELDKACNMLKYKIRMMATVDYRGETYVHGDIGVHNIMVNVNTDDDIDHIEDIMFIDFGHLGGNLKLCIESIDKMFKHLYNDE